MRDMPTHYKLITLPFIKFHDRCLLRQRALYAPRNSPSLSPSLSPSRSLRMQLSSLADTYIIYLREFTIPLMGIGVIGHPSAFLSLVLPPPSPPYRTTAHNPPLQHAAVALPLNHISPRFRKSARRTAKSEVAPILCSLRGSSRYSPPSATLGLEKSVDIRRSDAHLLFNFKRRTPNF